MIFIIQISLALISMTLLLNIRNVREDYTLAGIFSVLAIISIIFLILFFTKMKTKSPG